MTQLKLKVGDVCKVIANTCKHEFTIGEAVIIKKLYPDGVPPHYLCCKENEMWFLSDEELELIK